VSSQARFSPDRLNEVIDARMLSHVEAARLLAVPEKSLDRWRKGEVEPRRAAIRRMAEVFDREPLWFCELAEKEAA
jgi:DNA-binding transcriptional regulator YiaG